MRNPGTYIRHSAACSSVLDPQENNVSSNKKNRDIDSSAMAFVFVFQCIPPSFHRSTPDVWRIEV